jgi:hypothetical protein
MTVSTKYLSTASATNRVHITCPLGHELLITNPSGAKKRRGSRILCVGCQVDYRVGTAR